MCPSVHDITIDELSDLIASAPQEEDGGYDCVICGVPTECPSDLEQTAACDPCAQTAAIRLAEAVKQLTDVATAAKRWYEAQRGTMASQSPTGLAVAAALAKLEGV